MKAEWNGFTSGIWETEIDVRDFIQRNYTPYDGDDSFLSAPTAATTKLWEQVCALSRQEREKGGVLDMDTGIISTITSHDAGYLDQKLEKIVGFQTDVPFKRSLQPYGGIRMAEKACKDNGYTVDPQISEFFTKHRKTHNAGVFDAYTPEMRLARSSHIITGLPDAYGRGRIIGDYRRVALYGVDRLIADKEQQKASTLLVMTPEVIRDREELSEQIRALSELKVLGERYGCDISGPATNTQEAIQWLYFAYLAAIKEQNGAAMSLGRTSTFLDCYAQRDLKNGVFTEEQLQEFVDHFIMKLRLVKFARTSDYNQIFAGDPTWVTEAIGGMGLDGRPLITKMSFRYLHTLSNLGPAPEPNLTVLWSSRLPENFKTFCARTSIDSSAIQYENDDVMRIFHGDDYGIACCVSSMKIGKEMQFFGARANLAKCLLYAINGGIDELTGAQVGPRLRPITAEYLDYEEVMERFDDMLKWLAGLYVNTLNVIHYMHDKYSYERLQMSLHDREVRRYFATGIAGFSVIADSLSAIRYAKVKVRRGDIAVPDRKTGKLTVTARNVALAYTVEGDYPKFGNDDDRVDDLAVGVVRKFMTYIRQNETYRSGIPTTSVLTITSNVTYGKNTGATPDGRLHGQPFAPGANPLHGRDTHGAIASLASVAKLPFADAQDGISNTFTIVPKALGKEDTSQLHNLVEMMDAYMTKGGHHLNVNVLNRDTLLDAQAHPEQYPQLTIRVSGYAVNFTKLTRAQQDDVIARTFHGAL